MTHPRYIIMCYTCMHHFFSDFSSSSSFLPSSIGGWGEDGDLCCSLSSYSLAFILRELRLSSLSWSSEEEAEEVGAVGAVAAEDEEGGDDEAALEKQNATF